MIIKVDVNFDINFYVELRDNTLEDLMKISPSTSFTNTFENGNTYYAYTSVKETFDFESLSETIMKIDNEIEIFMNKFLISKFGSDIIYKNWFSTPKIKFEIEKIYGDYNAW